MVNESSASSGLDPVPSDSSASALPAWLARWPWATFVLPMAVYMLLGSLEPTPPSDAGRDSQTQNGSVAPSDEQSVEAVWEEERGGGLFPKIEYRHYPLVYTAKIVATKVFHGDLVAGVLLSGWWALCSGLLSVICS